MSWRREVLELLSCYHSREIPHRKITLVSQNKKNETISKQFILNKNVIPMV